MQAESYSLEYLASLLHAKVQGDPEHRISGLADIQRADVSDLTFVSGRAYQKFLSATAAGAVLLRDDLAQHYRGNALVVDDPYLSYAQLSPLFDHRPKPRAGIHPTAVVAETATVAQSASIGAHCVVEEGAVIGEDTELAAGVYVGANSRVGSGCRLYPQVVLYHGVRVGDRVTIHSATVVGSDGFGFAPSAKGWQKIHQLGGVSIADDVDIGSSCTIDRGAMQDTIIGRGVIMDNQVHVAHNVKIGEYTAIAGCCGIAGSTEIGAHCLFGGGVLVSGHLTIADGAQFNGATVVTRSIRESGAYASGTPLQPVKQWQKNAVRFGQLNQLFERFKAVEESCGKPGASDSNKS